MPPTLTLSRAEARSLMLHAQGLGRRPRRRARKADLLETIRRMGALQIDTISVVNRSPYFVLWSRLGAYDTDWLDQLHAEGALFEYWSHAACFLPIEDYPLYARFRLERRPNERWDRWMASRSHLIAAVLGRIRDEGPLRSADFEASERRPGGWWNWKDEKMALEALFNTGELVISGRRNFQRLYDLRQRVLPHWDDAQATPLADAERTLALRAVSALGVATGTWVRPYFGSATRATPSHLPRLAAEGLVRPVRVEGLGAPAFVTEAAARAVESSGIPRAAGTNLLSPFDPLVRDRRRAAELFGFDYTIECYTPGHKRRYGYFTLPILHDGALVGRLDPKAHRREGVFEVKSLHLEPAVRVTEGLVRGLARTLLDCAAWHGTPDVVIRASDPPQLAARLSTALSP